MNYKLLPARMSLNAERLLNLEIVVLDFPFSAIVKKFCQDIKTVTGEWEGNYYRQLNNAILACAPTLTHGFEFLYSDSKTKTPYHRALAVGTPDNPLRVPTTEQMLELIHIWINEWTKKLRSKRNDQIDSICDQFLETTDYAPADWQWIPISAKSLVQNLDADKGLAYQAIPSLLATLLHEKSCTIKGQNGEQNIRWRKVQGANGNRVGLFLVSNLFRAEYIDGSGKLREGFFSYRLDFRVQNQAGRFNGVGHLKPWIFLHLSCQRYASEPLSTANYGRDISILMSMNMARMTNLPIDSTLVRLVVQNVRDGQNKRWRFQLPELLAAFKVRGLIDPELICQSPLDYMRLDSSRPLENDEYYIVHAEGYKYKLEKHERGHSLKTGFSFAERGDITAKVLNLLEGTLISDTSIESDQPAPKGSGTPLALRNYKDYIAKPKYFNPAQRESLSEAERAELSNAYRKKRQEIAFSIYSRVSLNEEINLFLMWRERETYSVMYQQLRELFLLKENEKFPPQLRLHSICIEDGSLLEPLKNESSTSKDSSFRSVMKTQHQNKREAWRKFLQKAIPQSLPNQFAIVEIGKGRRKGIRPGQSIYGAVRDACALENISSQMLQTVKKKGKKEKKEEANKEESPYSKQTKGRVLQAALDITLRQIGALYGPPSDVYLRTGLPKNIARSLDMIALCRLRNIEKDVHYTIAIRLSATGTVDVLLPSYETWIPYRQAGIAIGKLFSEARGDQITKSKYRVDSKIKLKGAQLVAFAARAIAQKFARPTIVLIEAEGWRNEQGQYPDSKIWPQLKNEYLQDKRNVLDFRHVASHNCEYDREDSMLENLLAVVRLRSGQETPQYIPERDVWSEDNTPRNFTNLMGFYDHEAALPHYFSVGGLPSTQKKQDELQNRDLYMLDSNLDENGATLAFKHQQILEMVPFFIHPDFQAEEGVRSLCRCPHYLRTSPAWNMGNILHPYPMHLGIQLMADQLCILGSA